MSSSQQDDSSPETANALDYDSSVFAVATISKESTIGRLLTQSRKRRANGISGRPPSVPAARNRSKSGFGYFTNFSARSTFHPADESHSDIGFEKRRRKRSRSTLSLQNISGLLAAHGVTENAIAVAPINILGASATGQEQPLHRPLSLPVSSASAFVKPVSPIAKHSNGSALRETQVSRSLIISAPLTAAEPADTSFIHDQHASPSAVDLESSFAANRTKDTTGLTDTSAFSTTTTGKSTSPRRPLFSVTQVSECPVKSASEKDLKISNFNKPVPSVRRSSVFKAGRLVNKNGECNVSQINVPKQKWKYIRDIFTTLVDAKWRWSILIFSLAFIVSWALFGLVYWGIAVQNGDIRNSHNLSHVPCVVNIHSYASAFLYSVETQTTVGYGYRYTTEECPFAVIVMCIQSILGIMIQTFMTGFVFAKLARPEKRAETLIFSKNAVICMRDNRLCFLFRVGDMRKSHIVEAHVRLQMIMKRLTREGEVLPFHQFDMNVGFDLGLDRIFLVWPITICHVIDEDSPLYEYSFDKLAKARFEIVALLEGVVESRGMTTQARTSYLPSEILWGHRFEKLVTYQRQNGDYRIDFARFHSTYPCATPKCSARELEEETKSGNFPESFYYDHDRSLRPFSLEMDAYNNTSSKAPPCDEVIHECDENETSGSEETTEAAPLLLSRINNSQSPSKPDQNLQEKSTTVTDDGPPPIRRRVSSRETETPLTMVKRMSSKNLREHDIM